MSADHLLEIREALAAVAQNDDQDQLERLRKEEEELMVAMGPEGTALVGYPTGYPL